MGTPFPIAYLGPEGTFSELAALQFFAGRQYRGLTYPDIASALHAVEKEEADAAVVPIENSVEGTVNLTLDVLVHEVNLFINGEIVLPVVHHLLGKHGNFAAYRRVLSHPHALAQCRRFLQQHLPRAKWEPVISTAEAARLVGATNRPWAAVGTELAAARYGLKVVAREIQDHPDNATRFIVCQRGEAMPTGDDKTSIAFALPVDRPGELYHALGEFAMRGINLTKIESRPAKKGMGFYIFFIDCEGHHKSPAVAEALSALRARASFYKLLGSYPRYREA